MNSAIITTTGAEQFPRHYKNFLPLFIANGEPSEDTLRNYTREIDYFLMWCGHARVKPMTATKYDCIKYRSYLNAKKYSRATIQIKLAAVRAFYNCAVQMDILKENPAGNVFGKSPQIDDTKYQFITPEEADLIIVQIGKIPNKITRARNLAIFLLMYTEGLRTVEVFRMNDEEIDFSPERSRIWIHGKGHEDYIYPTSATMQALSEYLRVRPVPMKDGAKTPTFITIQERGLFTGRTWIKAGERLTRQGIRWIINDILTQTGLKREGLSCHALRHSCGTNLYKATKDLRVVQETLRHKNPEITARYAHIQERTENRPTEKTLPPSIARIFKGV